MTQDDALRYQAGRLKDLLQGMLKCCEERVDMQEQTLGLPCSEINCLRLFSEGRYLTLTGLSFELGVAKSRAAALIEALLRRGLVERTADPADARIKLIALTQQGKSTLDMVHRHESAVHQEVLRRLHPAERDQVLTSLEKLRYCMELVKEELKEGGGKK